MSDETRSVTSAPKSIICLKVFHLLQIDHLFFASGAKSVTKTMKRSLLMRVREGGEEEEEENMRVCIDSENLSKAEKN